MEYELTITCSNFDNAVDRIRLWNADRPTASANPSPSMSPSSSTAHLVGLGLSMSSVSNPGMTGDGSGNSGAPPLTSGQRKRIKTFLKRAKMHPQHSQINLETYILLAVQRIPRYKLLVSAYHMHLLFGLDPAYIAGSTAPIDTSAVWLSGRSFGQCYRRNIHSSKPYERRQA